jgi:hypothetical protein
MLIPRVSAEQSNIATTGNMVEKQGWIRAETMRRTIFVVQAVNVLSARVGLQDLPCFHDSLDDELVMNIPLPVSEAVWKSTYVLDALPWMPDPELLPRDITPSECCTLFLGPSNNASDVMGDTQISFEQLISYTRPHGKASETSNA